MTTKQVYVNGPQELQRRYRSRSVFVAHSFFNNNAEKKRDYRLFLNDAISREGYRPIFPDEVAHPGSLLYTICQHILDCDLSIFDITGYNSNVLIELGLAIGMNQPILVILEDNGTDLPPFLAELNPMMYKSKVDLARQLGTALIKRVQDAQQSIVRDQYCVVCGENCDSRHLPFRMPNTYTVVGVDPIVDEELDYHISETLDYFNVELHSHDLAGNLTVCQWINKFQNVKLALFYLKMGVSQEGITTYHSKNNAAIYVQLGIAAGLGVPWTMILPTKQEPLSDLKGLLYISAETDSILRSALTNSVKGLLLKDNRFGVYEDLPDADYWEVEQDQLQKQSRPKYPSQGNKMERFTQRARRVLSLAQEEAERFQHIQIGTEHLLLGLLLEEGGIAGRVLFEIGLNRQHIEELVVDMSQSKQMTEIGIPRIPDLTPNVKKALELSVDEARRMGHHYIGTEHLLLALVSQADSVAIELLKRLAINPDDVRRQTKRILQEDPDRNRRELPRRE
jgi:hypothetical protein